MFSFLVNVNEVDIFFCKFLELIFYCGNNLVGMEIIGGVIVLLRFGFEMLFVGVFCFDIIVLG